MTTETELTIELARVKKQLRSLDRQSDEAAELRVKVGDLTGQIHRLRQEKRAGKA